MKFEEALLYQFYPMRLPGVEEHNSWNSTEAAQNRIGVIADWIPHLKRLGVDAVYFSPVFQSDCHGYDTRDYYTIDSRLGTNEDFARLCDDLHRNGIAIILDAVFNHTGRGFWAFRDVQQRRQESPYKDWYHISWDGNSPFNDGFYYEGWEGCMNLVKLNLQNPAVKEHLFGAIKKWVDLFHIDGLRLDVAYSLPKDFLEELNRETRAYPSMFGEGNFLLIGESIHSNTYDIADGKKCHSCTNYETYKGLYSSLNDCNMFELAHSLNRQFGEGGILEGKHLISFADNHDVTRFASILKDRRALVPGYTLLFTMPGVPCVYYGSEWEITGNKNEGDNALRPPIAQPEWTATTDVIARLAQIRKEHPAIIYGGYRNLCITNGQLVFSREHTCPFTGKHEQIVVAVNISDSDCTLHASANYPVFDGIYGDYKNLLDDQVQRFDGAITIRAKSAQVYVRL